MDREILYGGAAGGGKSDALLMGALQFATVPGYAAIIFRRTYADLSLPGALMDRSFEWLGGKARWQSVDKTWLFPAGGRLTFGYLQNLNDHYRYQSAEFQFCAFDELTQFDESQYRYLFSRLRRLEGVSIPVRMRAASNPGGRGHEWVKKRFIVPDCGRTFIPATLSDNPHLDRDEYVKTLAELDPVTRAQLLSGDWETYQGGRIRREWLRYYHRRGGYFLLAGNMYPIDQMRRRWLTVDTATSVKEGGKDDPDYTVISAWCLAPAGELVWLGCLRVRVQQPDIAPRVADQYLRHKVAKAIVEAGGTQKGVAQFLRRHKLPSGAHMTVQEYIPVGDKLQRAHEFICMAEAGRVYLPAEDPMFPLEEVEGELVRFTGDPKKDSHDDIVDTASMAALEAVNKIGRRDAGFMPYVVPVKPRA